MRESSSFSRYIALLWNSRPVLNLSTEVIECRFCMKFYISIKVDEPLIGKTKVLQTAVCDWPAACLELMPLCTQARFYIGAMGPKAAQGLRPTVSFKAFSQWNYYREYVLSGPQNFGLKPRLIVYTAV